MDKNLYLYSIGIIKNQRHEIKGKRREHSRVFMSRREVKETFFNQINRIVDWSRLRPIIERGYAKGTSLTGRPCYDAMFLFRIELLRTWYNLSDVEVE